MRCYVASLWIYLCAFQCVSGVAAFSLHSAYVLSLSLFSLSLLGDDRWRSFTTDTFRGSID